MHSATVMTSAVENARAMRGRLEFDGREGGAGTNIGVVESSGAVKNKGDAVFAEHGVARRGVAEIFCCNSGDDYRSGAEAT